ncbi:MAG: hypothetical protein AAFO91_00940 [Bacteroidota bacterium]
MKRLLITAWFVACLVMFANAQGLSLRLSGNQTFLLGADYPASYPMIGWFQGNFEPQNGLLIGGFGLGLRLERPMGNKFFEYQIVLGRSRTYEPRIQYIDANAQPIGLGYGINSNYHSTLIGMIAWPLDSEKRLRLHAGLGLRTVIVSESKYWIATGLNQSETTSGPNNSLNTFTLLLPLEFSYSLGRITLATRWELGVTRYSRISGRSQQRGLWGHFEIGYDLQKPETK